MMLVNEDSRRRHDWEQVENYGSTMVMWLAGANSAGISSRTDRVIPLLSIREIDQRNTTATGILYNSSSSSLLFLVFSNIG